MINHSKEFLFESTTLFLHENWQYFFTNPNSNLVKLTRVNVNSLTLNTHVNCILIYSIIGLILKEIKFYYNLY